MAGLPISVPTPDGTLGFEATPGTSVVFVGANGSGKTRLGVKLEDSLRAIGKDVHRIGAHRSLHFNDSIQVISYEKAESFLLYGQEDGNLQAARGSRWQGRPATILLTDFDHLLRALYADENRLSVEHRQRHRKDPHATAPETRLDRLKEIWHALLPHRQLVVLDGEVKVSPVEPGSHQYKASELSDGERVIFYLLGQCLLAKRNGAIIVDEPELHIHKAILAKLWDAVESERKDCVFVYLTHDLEFATSRSAARKFAVSSYLVAAKGEQWIISELPEDTGIPEEVVSRILGSRQPVVFVEGDSGSLDVATYRRIYVDWTVIPVGGCEQVIHTVATFRRQPRLHRFGCVGLIDSDDRPPQEVEALRQCGVHTLPVAEVENLYVLPDIFRALARTQGFSEQDAQAKVDELTVRVLSRATAEIDQFSLTYARLQLDRKMKAIGLSATDLDGLRDELQSAVSAIDLVAIHNDIRSRLSACIAAKDAALLLAVYSNKGLLAEAAAVLGYKKRKDLEEYIGRMLRADAGEVLRDAIRSALPDMSAPDTAATTPASATGGS